MSQRRAGIFYLKVDGKIYDAKGNFTYNLGKPKREAIVGADQIHGYKEMVTVPFIEGELTDSLGLSLDALNKITDSTVTISLANGKTVVLHHAWMASEMNVQTEEGNIAIRFEGLSADEVK